MTKCYADDKLSRNIPHNFFCCFNITRIADNINIDLYFHFVKGKQLKSFSSFAVARRTRGEKKFNHFYGQQTHSIVCAMVFVHTHYF